MKTPQNLANKTSSTGPGLLIGCGRMGQRHLKHLGTHAATGEVHLVDPIYPEARFTSLESALRDSQPRWAIVAVSTPAHYAVGIPLLERGLTVLMEKPLAPTARECDELLAAANRHGASLFVGHSERFNPVVRALGSFLKSGDPGHAVHFHMTRWGAAPAEVLPGNNVVVDLTVHDIDILHSLGFAPRLVGAQKIRTRDHVSHLEATLSLGEETVATMSTSWQSSVRKRTIRVLCTKGIIEADLIGQTLKWEGEALSIPAVQPIEPLAGQLDEFFKAVAGERSTVCTGAEGARAVALAAEMLNF